MDEATASVLRRIARAAPPAPAPITPARALRLSLTRAAERSVGLSLGVLGVAEEVGPLDDLLSRLDAGLMLVALARGDRRVGLVGLDAEARAAVIEAQTLGRPAAAAAAPRPVTAADVALSQPLLAAFLQDLEGAAEGSAVAGWADGARPDGRLPGAREAAMTLPDGTYRAVRLTLDIGAGGRQGLLLLLIRLPDDPEEAAPPAGPAWHDLLAEQVMRAQGTLEAVLHRLSLPIDAVEALRPGQVLPLPGAGVGSVRMEGPGGRDVGPGRLGQAGGMRAVRIEAPAGLRLADLRPGP